MKANLGMSGDLHARLITNKRKKFKRYEIIVPGIGRIGYTRDPGEASMFANAVFDTALHAVHLDPCGKVLGEYSFGSGLVTNVGVLALAQDGLGAKLGKAKESFGVIPNLKWHAWGSSNTAATIKDIKLGSLKKPTETNAVEATNTLSTKAELGKGGPKLISKAKIKAESSFEVVEWGIFTKKTLSATTGTPLTAKTATSGTVTATPLTASSEEALGERLQIVVPTEATEIWGLITENTTSVITVPEWVKQSTEAEQEPTATSPFTIKPVMWDHRVISPISVESGNEIEWIYELAMNSGG